MKNCTESTPLRQQPYEDNYVDRLSLISDRACIARSPTDRKFITNARNSGPDNLYAKIAHNNLSKNQLRHPVLDKNQLRQSMNLAVKPLNKANSFDTAALQQHLPYSNYENGTKFAKYSTKIAKFNGDVAAFRTDSLLKIKESHCSEPTSNGIITMPFIGNECFDY